MYRLVAVVICVALAGAASADAALPVAKLVRAASRAAHLSVLRPVRTVVETPGRFAAGSAHRLDRDYPPALQRLDDEMYADLGLERAPGTLSATLTASVSRGSADYDPATRVVHVRRAGLRTRELLRELVRALVDQHYGLSTMLRQRDRDRALAATASVDGYASVVSRVRSPTTPADDPLARFVAVEANAPLTAGRALVSQLQSIGGVSAVHSALARRPQTTEQVLHLDKFLEHEAALAVALPARIGDESLVGSETFGELDVRALLSAFAVADADSAADGWGGGRLALYRGATGAVTALVLRWDTADDAAEWRAAASKLVGAAFPSATPHVCPAVDACWLEGDRELAVASRGTTSAYASGSGAELVAALLVR